MSKMRKSLKARSPKYLLSTTHRAGKSKASFFMQFGFDLDRWESLALALKRHPLENEVALEEKDDLWNEVHC